MIEFFRVHVRDRSPGRSLLFLKPIPRFYSEVSTVQTVQSTCCYFKTALTEIASHHTEAK